MNLLSNAVEDGRGGGLVDGSWKGGEESVSVEDDYHIDKDPAVLEAKEIEDPVDTQEYRSFEELRWKSNGNGSAH
ncbi:hypothetical protein JRO89_XS15G0108500 [Xanthoceras sorbifolium]|uniref:Uncharacterized protein n=1 Tax=Xanthoceras sorbifolium TaxID=99658 RepID=A0ABQ8H1M5_9ROSI|nr:hypothetical protein JRO89_XS15G0108500 [Xanthoceras sorbifolium]